jgi:hypothetical protein
MRLIYCIARLMKAESFFNAKSQVKHKSAKNFRSRSFLGRLLKTNAVTCVVILQRSSDAAKRREQLVRFVRLDKPLKHF